jgi:hypothetical protein
MRPGIDVRLTATSGHFSPAHDIIRCTLLHTHVCWAGRRESRPTTAGHSTSRYELLGKHTDVLGENLCMSRIRNMSGGWIQ